MGNLMKDVVEHVKLKEVPYGGCCKQLIELHPSLFKDNSLSKGGLVKARGQVMREHSRSISRPPNMNCRIQSFGRICKKFDVRRTRWVNEMGFGGILHLVSDMHLPRHLAYWVMTGINPMNRMLVSPDGREFPLSKNQVRWVLGTPCGSKSVPSSKSMTTEVHEKVHNLIMKYGRSWKTKSSRGCGSVYTLIGIPITTQMMDRLEGNFDDADEEEFKTVFLILVLHMVLCPTLSPRLVSDLILALSYVMVSVEYDWSELVLKKLIDSVSSIARRFYATGYAGGCRGCAIFVVIFYLDRRDRPQVQWDVFPRLKVWSMHEIAMAAKEDRATYGDFGKLGLIDVAYGESHLTIARDMVAPTGNVMLRDVSELVLSNTERQRRIESAKRELGHTPKKKQRGCSGKQ